MSEKIVYVPGPKGWVKGNARGGLCFNVSFDRLELLLRGEVPCSEYLRLKANEGIEHVEIDEHGISVYIGPKRV